MSVESKIKQLLEGVKSPATKLDEAAVGSELTTKDTTIAAANEGDRNSRIPQGSSQQADYEEINKEDEENQEQNRGAVASSSTPNSPRPQQNGPGAAPNFQTVGDPTSVVNMPGSQGNVSMEEVDIKGQLANILGESVSDEFKSKATSLFEAAVVARVAAEMQTAKTKLEEAAATALAEEKENLVNKIDSYISYVIEQWMEENKLAVDTGLRSEIAEDFITGLKTLFTEHYIEIPEDKYDVVAESQKQIEALKAQLNETVEDAIALSKEVINLKKARIVESYSKGLAATEGEKLRKLVEGIEYEDDKTFGEQVASIKETYFPKAPKTAQSADQLTEDVAGPANTGEVTEMDVYAKAISRAISRK